MGAKGRGTAFLAILAIALAVSCATKPAAKAWPADYASMKAEELEALAVTDPAGCIEAVSMIASAPESGGALSGGTAEKLALEAAGNMAALFDAAVSSGNWSESEKLLSSLKAVSLCEEDPFIEAARKARSSIGPGSEGAVLYGKAREYLKKNLYAPAMLYFLRALDTMRRGSAELRGAVLADMGEWVSKAAGCADRDALVAMDECLPEAGVRAMPGIADVLSRPKNLESMVSGVVTVYVDKGIRIQGGMGVPDRVVGTAFQIDPEGYYLTNYHVIESEVDPAYEGYSRLSIRPSGNPEARIPAVVLGWDKDLDLALVKCGEAAPYTFHLSSLETAEKGEAVYAMGSPVGLENTITAGIVSAKGRRFLPRGEALQVDVPVNPGNSGGPLVGKTGGVKGVIFSGLPDFQGINFALPAEWIGAIVPALFDGGKQEKPWIGAMLSRKIDGSLLVGYAYPSAAGMRAGDRLVSLDAEKPADIQGAQLYITRKPLHSLCLVELVSDGKVVRRFRKLDAVPEMPLKKAFEIDSEESLLAGSLGMILGHVSGPRGRGGTYTVLDAFPAMPADEAGIRNGDTLKFLRYTIDRKQDIVYFDIAMKSRTTGYLERALRLAVSLENSSFI